jgi:DNA-binding NtrC family response regulator
MSRSILILDTATGDLRDLAETFRPASGPDGKVDVVRSLEDLLGMLSGGEACDLVVVDFLLGDGRRTGADIISAIREVEPDVPIVAVAEQGNVEIASRAVQAGAADFLVRGAQLQERVSTLLSKVRKLLDLADRNRYLREQNRLLQEAGVPRFSIVGQSPQIRGLLERIERVAKIPRPVLILGERGTGKELVARAIHGASGRAGPFLVVNCSAFPDTLLESELFGHEKGAFTGAESVVRGKFEQSSGGTLFLDEISHMSLAFQQKILRVVEYGSFTRVGGGVEITSTARILAATNADLGRLIQEGKFLADLHDRIAFEVIHVPPLRERKEDVEILARHFLEQFMLEIPSMGRKRLGAEAIERLRRHDFPGNVRELKNIIERAAYRETASEIRPEDIGLLPSTSPPPPTIEGSFEEKVEGFKSQMVLDALRDAGGNQAGAARALGLSYHQFRYYIRKYGKSQAQ